MQRTTVYQPVNVSVIETLKKYVMSFLHYASITYYCLQMAQFLQFWILYNVLLNLIFSNYLKHFYCMCKIFFPVSNSNKNETCYYVQVRIKFYDKNKTV